MVVRVTGDKSEGMKPGCLISCCGDLGVKGHRFLEVLFSKSNLNIEITSF